MNRLMFTVILICCCTSLFSQRHTEDYKITLPDYKVSNSLYTSIRYLDSRYDTSNMGIVQLGAFNKKARVIPKIHFAEQLSDLINALVDSTAKNGELLCQLRQFNFAEITGAMSEKGYCYVKADIYAHTDNGYIRTGKMDTVIFIKTMDVTRALFRNASKALVGFIAASLVKAPENGIGYNLNDIVHIDNIEKKEIPVYNTDVYADGLYETFMSFKDQYPDKKITAEIKDGKLSGVKAEDENGKMEKVKSKNIYAVVHQGKPFIATD